MIGILLAWPPCAAAQDRTTVTGVVIDGATGIPIPDVRVDSGQAPVATALDGRCSVVLREGDTTLRFRADGYLETFLEVADPDIEVRLLRNTFAETVEVVSEIIAQPRPSSTPLPPEELCQVAGSVDNVFRTLDLLPGVAATDDFGSRLAVRGGTPDQNLTVMDGVEIHNPYRLFGITSAFNPATVERFQHQIGNKATREIPGSILYNSDSHLEAWDRRVAMGPMGAAMSGSFRRLGDQRGMFADWTDRIATGEAATQRQHPPRSTREARPRG